MGCNSSKETEVTVENVKPNLKRGESLLKDSKLSDFKNKFEFISVLGNGGFGKVRLYRDKDNKTMKYAIKTLQKDYFNTVAIQYIIDEVKTLKVLDHPSICKYFDTYEDDVFIHIVMEYIPGDDLFKLITQRKYNHYTEFDVYEIIYYLMKGVHFLHNNNILHRDIKPENILFSIPGDYKSAKLIDFGLASNVICKRKDIVGSIHYMAPEVLDSKYYFETDTWSIGVILYTIITGKHPFEGKTKNEISEKIMICNYDKKLLEDKKVSEEVKDLIMNLLVHDHKNRFNSEKALDHKWFKIWEDKKKVEKSFLDKDIIDSLKKFSNKNLFQKEILFYLAKISDEQEIQKLKNAFIEIDKDNSGTIEYEEVIVAFKKVGIENTVI